MKILIMLFSPPAATWGSLTRVLALADAAEKNGHKIAICAAGDLLRRLKKLGYQTFAMPEATYFGLPKFLSRIIGKLNQRVTLPAKEGKAVGNMWFVYFLMGISKCSYLKKLVAAEVTAAKNFQPDFLFTEVDPAAYLTSHILNIPIAVTYSSVLLRGIGGFHWRVLKKNYEKILRSYQKEVINPQDTLLDEKVLKIIPSVPELENITENNNVVFIGYLQKNFAVKREVFQPAQNKHYVFVYVGSGSLTVHNLKEILPQVSQHYPDIDFLVGSQSVAQEERIANVYFRSYWDAEQIISHCDWVICHGGHNTIIQSLMNGVPLIIFPGPIFERRFNAEMVQKSGSGVMGEISNFTSEWICNVMSRQNQFKEKAEELSKKIIALGGADTAIKAMERSLLKMSTKR